MAKSRRSSIAAACVSAALSSAVLTSCGTTVDGRAQPVQGSTPGASSGVDLSKLLLDPAQFPDGFDAVVLPPRTVSQAAPDLTGVPSGATVDPSRCTPPEQDYGPVTTAMAVGTDSDTRATISMELTRSQATVDELEDKAEDCAQFSVTSSGIESVVTTRVMPPPPIDADDTLALHRTVESGDKGKALVQSMTTLIAEVDDVRISATLMSFGQEKPDMAPLHETFVAAVQKVQHF